MDESDSAMNSKFDFNSPFTANEALHTPSPTLAFSKSTVLAALRPSRR